MPEATRARTLGLIAAGGLLGTAYRWRRHPSACPYRLRERAENVGLTFASRLGSPLGYFSRFQRIRP